MESTAAGMMAPLLACAGAEVSSALGNGEATSAAPEADAAARTTLNRAMDALSFCVILLTVFATAGVLYFASAVLLPLTMAVFLWLLFRPVVRSLGRRRIPESLSAAILLAALIGVILLGFLQLRQPTTEWLENAPIHFAKVREKLRGVIRPIQEIEKASEEVGKMAPAEGVTPPLQVEVKQPRFSTLLVGTTSTTLAGVALTFTIAFFLLARGDSLLANVIQILPTLNDKKKAIELVRSLEHAVSNYLVKISLINLGLGVAEGIAMWLVGMPNPLLWGVLAALLNFIPYIGGLVNVVIIFFVSLLTFETMGEAFLPAILFIGINAVEGNFVTPYVLGRSFQLNPILVFLSLTVWSFLWGVGGMLLAIPLLAVFRITCDHFEKTRSLGVLLSE